MKTRLLFIFTLLFFFNYTNGQEKTVSDKIKIERDVELGKLTSELNESDRVIDSLQLSLTSVKGNKKKVESST